MTFFGVEDLFRDEIVQVLIRAAVQCMYVSSVEIFEKPVMSVLPVMQGVLTYLALANGYHSGFSAEEPLFNLSLLMTTKVNLQDIAWWI